MGATFCGSAYLDSTLALTRNLASLEAAATQPLARYYRVAGGAVPNTTNVRYQAETYVGGGKSAKRVFHLVAICPVSPPAASVRPVWLAYEYWGELDTLDPEFNFLPRYERFQLNGKQAFRRAIATPSTYLEYRDDNVGAWASTPQPTPLVLWPIFTPFEKRAGNMGRYWLWSQLIGLGLFSVLVWRLPLNPDRVQVLVAAEPLAGGP